MTALSKPLDSIPRQFNETTPNPLCRLDSQPPPSLLRPHPHCPANPRPRRPKSRPATPTSLSDSPESTSPTTSNGTSKSSTNLPIACKSSGMKKKTWTCRTVNWSPLQSIMPVYFLWSISLRWRPKTPPQAMMGKSLRRSTINWK